MFFALVNTEFSAIDTEMTDLNGHIQIMCLDCHPLNCMYLLTVYCVTPLSPPLFTALNLNFLTFLAFLTFNCDSDEEQSRAEQSKAKQSKAKQSHLCIIALLWTVDHYDHYDGHLPIESCPIASHSFQLTFQHYRTSCL
jgi:hypothetical protein